jgi:uncharacterized protein YfaS (alpha-2-macroglobulin family)
MLMSSRLLAALLCGLCLLAITVTIPPAQAQKALVREDLRNDAVRLETDLRRLQPNAATRPAATWRQDVATAIRAGNTRGALAAAAGAVLADPRDGASWLALADTALAIADATQDWSERYTNRDRATAAAYAAYERATGRPAEAAALAMLGRAYQAREMWRPALDTYRLSLAAGENPRLRATYAELREKHGFQIRDYKVDSDAATPRICFTFSAPLARGRVDFAPFVVVQGATSPAVTADGQQLCVDGLKHGERYRIVLRQGLPSSVDEQLLKTADYDIYVRDRSPQVRFTGRNYVLPRTGQEGIPVVSVNTDKVELDVYRIGDRSLAPTVRSEDFMKQLSEFSARDIERQKGVKLWSGQLATRNELNRDMITAFPVSEALPALEPGVHVMTARVRRLAQGPAGEDDGSFGDDLVTQWFVVSDLGLTAFAGQDGVHVLARSLATAQPVGGVALRLIARNNEVLATVNTDAAGYARFDAGLARGTDGMAPAIVAASDGKGDYGFLDVAAAAFDLSDRGVKGRTAPIGLDAFLATERGVYRPGETINVTTLLRDGAGKVVPNLPLTLVYKRPDGVEHRRAVVADQGAGGRAHSLALFSAAARGTWRIEAYADVKARPIGELKFLVEDYVPDRVDVTLATAATSIRAGSAASVDVSARYLYGAPGADLAISGEVSLAAAWRTPLRGYEDYLVGLTDQKVEPVTKEIEEAGNTDAQGKATVAVTLPESEAQRPLEATIKLRVGEAGGRAVERTLTLPVALDGPVVAVKKLFDDGGLSAGALAQFAVIAANPDGSRLARDGLSWTVSRIDRTWQWYLADGRWNYEATRTSRRVADGRINVGTGEPARLSIPADWGSYRLDISMGGAQTSVAYSVGHAGELTADAPDVLDVALDKDSYTNGEAMVLNIKPRFGGRATVAIIGDKAQTWREVDLPAGGTQVRLAASADWGAGAYAVVLAHRPLDQAARRMPGRALGVAWFSVDRAARALPVTLDLPQRIRPRASLDIPVTLAGLQAGEEAFVTISAVDVGILNLTRHEPPKPAEHFFGQRQLSGEMRDLYGYLIDGMQGVRGAIRSGGDAGVDTSVSPPREAPLARYSGVIRVGADGKARVSFDIPAFDGAVRVDVMAWSAGRVGTASREVIIRDALVAQATLPRFLSLGDRSRFHVRIDNIEGPAGEYTAEVVPSGPLIMPADALLRRLQLAAGQATQLSIPVTASGVGDAAVTVRLTGPGGAGVERSLPIRVSPGSDAILRRVVRRIAPSESLTVSADLVQDLLPGSGSVSTSVSLFGGIDVPALLAALDRYPYGCTEQVISRALPLLYVNQLASRERLALDDKIDERIRDAVDRVLARQDSSGSFGVWSVGGDDPWLDAFALDFLTRAREKGIAVPQRALDTGLDRLRNTVVNQPEFQRDGGEKITYALYVLARNGRPMMSDLRYIIDTRLSEAPTPLARAQIAAALALLGDRARAERGFKDAIVALTALRDSPTDSRRDYGSRLRDAAAIMALAAENNASGADLIQTAALVSEARTASRYTSTQENAWLVLAAQAGLRDANQISLSVDGQNHSGALHRSDRASALEARPLVIANRGSVPVDAVLTVSGNPLEPQPAAMQGYQIERTYYRLNGQKVDAATVAQNDRLVVVLTVTEREKRRGSLMLVDHLPAGLEIDNPSLVDSGKVESLGWLKREIEPTHTEYRDDRFVAVFDRWDDKQAIYSVAYMVRAVSPGRYVHPPAVIEDMYRPGKYGRTAYGQIEVTGR